MTCCWRPLIRVRVDDFDTRRERIEPWQTTICRVKFRGKDYEEGQEGGGDISELEPDVDVAR